MKKNILLLHILVLTGMSSGLLAMSAITGLFTNQANKLTEEVKKNYPAAFRTGSAYLKERANLGPWDKAVAEVGKFVVSKKDKEKHFDNAFKDIQDSNNELANTNKFIVTKYGGKFDATLQSHIDRLDKLQYKLADAFEHIAKSSVDKEAKTVLTTIIELMNKTITDVHKVGAQVQSEATQKVFQSARQPQSAYKRSGSSEKDAQVNGANITSANLKSFGKNLSQLQADDLVNWQSAVLTMKDFLKANLASDAMMADFAALMLVNEAVVNTTKTIKTAQLNNKQISKPTRDAIVVDLEKARMKIQPILTRYKDNKDPVKFELYRFALTLDTIIVKLKKEVGQL